MKIKDILILAASIGGSLLAGIIGSIFTTTGPGSWYDMLIKPSFNPPNWIFGPVWTLLYVLMGISLYLIIKNKTREKKRLIILFSVQLVLNLLWSIIFFGLQSPVIAFLEITVLWIAIILTMTSFHRVSAVAGLLFIPYILWVTFAAILNLAIVVLNS